MVGAELRRFRRPCWSRIAQPWLGAPVRARTPPAYSRACGNTCDHMRTVPGRMLDTIAERCPLHTDAHCLHAWKLGGEWHARPEAPGMQGTPLQTKPCDIRGGGFPRHPPCAHDYRALGNTVSQHSRTHWDGRTSVYPCRHCHTLPQAFAWMHHCTPWPPCMSGSVGRCLRKAPIATGWKHRHDYRPGGPSVWQTRRRRNPPYDFGSQHRHTYWLARTSVLHTRWTLCALVCPHQRGPVGVRTFASPCPRHYWALHRSV